MSLLAARALLIFFRRRLCQFRRCVSVIWSQFPGNITPAAPSLLASQLLNFPSRALRPPLRQHPCLNICNAHPQPPLARGGRVVCLPWSFDFCLSLLIFVFVPQPTFEQQAQTKFLGLREIEFWAGGLWHKARTRKTQQQKNLDVGGGEMIKGGAT